ncbi:MAG TPA: biotin/lipoyl-containing protein [Steroidobacteraceae bacterium]|nr:biotin/lipoyl-containing protein [Steroidobacteraceae bacterium]HUK02215.1 biotin/lipoyl-containing protein [Steroidobacteraceae bacterium]
MILTDDDVREIVKLLESSSFNELELETDRFKLTLRRGGTSDTWTQERSTRSSPHLLTPAPAPAPAEISPAGESALAPAANRGIEIRPPLMGTFYRAPKPGAAPFVEIGARVTPESVVGIIETMKLMNSVYAGASGTVTEICAANGQLVEPHDVLMRLAPGAG